VVDGIAAQVGSDTVLVSEVRDPRRPVEEKMRAAGAAESDLAALRADALERLIDFPGRGSKAATRHTPAPVSSASLRTARYRSSACAPSHGRGPAPRGCACIDPGLARTRAHDVGVEC
jgi:hypothetical protein